MTSTPSRLGSVVTVAIAVLVAAGAALADDRSGPKPRFVFNGSDDPSVVNADARFVEPQGLVIRGYYVRQIEAGQCPSGLEKRGSDCLPTEQPRKWQIGRALPRGVVAYELPPALAERLGPPPTGHRYVRVANDVLLLTQGSGIVVDAITDLGRM